MVTDFESASGKKLTYHQISNEQYMSFLPESMAEEVLENHLLIGEPGYYAGASLKESQDALESKPTTWKEYVARNYK